MPGSVIDSRSRRIDAYSARGAAVAKRERQRIIAVLKELITAVDNGRGIALRYDHVEAARLGCLHPGENAEIAL